MDETIIYKYLSGLATEDEQLQLLAWLKASSENRKAFFEIKALWKARHSLVSAQEGERRVKNSLALLNQRIDRFVPFYTKPQLTYRAIYSAAAIAVVLLILSVSLTFFYHKKEISSSEIVCVNLSQDSVKKVILPDGTRVWLNADTRLTYPSLLTGNQRRIRLNGEAFFEVAKDALRPFIVETDALLTQVIGTSFCINTRPADGISHITLQTGAIQLLQTTGEKLVALRPGQQAVYSQHTNRIEVREVNVDEYTSWRFDLMVMSNMDVSSIINRIEDLYNVKIKMDTFQLTGRKYNFSFRKDRAVSHALRRLSYMTGIPADTIR